MSMSESERKAFLDDMLQGDSDDGEDDDYELEDIHGIYDLSEKTKRYTVLNYFVSLQALCMLIGWST